MNVELITSALDVKAVIDIVILIIIVSLGVTAWRWARYPGIAIVLTSMLVFIYSQTMVSQTMAVTKFPEDDVTHVVIKNKGGIKLSPNTRNTGVLGCQFLFFPQLINYVTGDETYTFTRRAALGHLISSFPEVHIRTKTSKLPKTVMIVSQHIPCVFDIWGFLAMTDDDHKLDVIQDLGPETYKRYLTNIYLRKLYGARPIERSNKEILEAQIEKLANDLVSYREGEGKHAVCIWPSGKFWQSRFENGFEKFKPGSFYLSIYSQVPICPVHTRFNHDKVICVRGGIIYPPKLPTESFKEMDYKTFSREPEIRTLVENYRSEVERIFRNMDNAMCRELNI